MADKKWPVQAREIQIIKNVYTKLNATDSA